MARTANPKAKVSKAITSKALPSIKATPKRKSAPAPESNDGSEDTPPPPSYLDKTFVLRLILAKLEVTKSCDWYDLAQRMGEKSINSVPAKGRKKKEVGKMWSGGELHDIFHDTILPALKVGRALWSDDAIASDLYLPPRVVEETVEVSAEEAKEIAAMEEEVRQEELESEEEEGSPYEMTTVGEKEPEDDEERAVEVKEAEEEQEEEVMEEEVIVEEEVEEQEAPVEVIQVKEKEVEDIEQIVEVEEVDLEEEKPEEEVERVKRVKAKAKRPPKPETREIIKSKPTSKPATTYRKPKTASNVPPTLGYHQSVVNSSGDSGKKRIRPAYGSDEDSVTVRSSPSSKSKSTTSAPSSKKSKTSVTPPSSGRVGRGNKKAVKYVDVSGSEEE